MWRGVGPDPLLLPHGMYGVCTINRPPRPACVDAGGGRPREDAAPAQCTSGLRVDPGVISDPLKSPMESGPTVTGEGGRTERECRGVECRGNHGQRGT